MNDIKMLKLLEQLNENLEAIRWAVERHSHDNRGNPISDNVVKSECLWESTYKHISKTTMKEALGFKLTKKDKEKDFLEV